MRILCQRSQITQLREELDSNKRELENLRQSLAREQTSAATAVQSVREKFESYARLVHELKAEHEKSAKDGAMQNLSSDFQNLRSSVSSLTHGELLYAIRHSQAD
jgi:predicted  nucleic acid-binding Zn-ribbon protein